MPAITAIQTSYKGYRFRSRLEARWAVFFDSLGIKWDYEPEGFELGDAGRYLPDFFVHMPDRKPGWGYWVEVKGLAPTDLEREKARALAVQSEHRVYLVHGMPCENVPEPIGPLSSGLLGQNALFETAWSALVVYCSTITDTGWIARAIKARDAARSARFEFGESGARL